MTRILGIALLLFISFFSYSQEITLEQAVMAWSNDLYPSGKNQLKWLSTGSQFTFVEDNALMIEGIKGKAKKLIDTDGLESIVGFAFKSFPRYSWSDDGRLSFNKDNKAYFVDLKRKKFEVQDLPEDAENIDHHKKSGHIAFTRAHNLFVQKDGNTLSVSNNPEGLVAGQAIARYEFGITKGTFWNNSGTALAFYQKDERHVGDYPLVEYNTTPAALRSIKYPMAGSESEYAAVGVYDMKTGKSTYLDFQRLGKDEFYATNVCWSPDDRFVYVAVVTRDQNQMILQQFNASNGQLEKVLFQEKDQKYVEPEHPLYFVPNKGNEFIWISEKDGFNNLYHYTDSGKLIAKTQATFPITEFLGFSDDAKFCFVMGTGKNATESHLFKVNLADMSMSRLSKAEGVHNITPSSDFSYFIDEYSNISTPGITQIIDAQGKELKPIHIAPNPLEGKKTGDVSLVDITAKDGTKLHARLIKPSNFDPKKKYPVLVYVYNGPHVQLVTNSWNGGAPLWMNSFAEEGYLVFSVDGRGSANRGKDFEQAIHRNLGELEMSDQLNGVEYLKSLEYVDENRMAVHGWSYGGFMTTSLMLRQPGTFKVGVAGGPVIDWNYYEVMYTERYMDSPQDNPEGYEKANLKNYVSNLEGQLLMIHGTVDDVVVMQHNMSFLTACIDEGVQVDFFVYPGHPHNVRGKDRVHLMTKVLNYIKAAL